MLGFAFAPARRLLVCACLSDSVVCCRDIKSEPKDADAEAKDVDEGEDVDKGDPEGETVEDVDEGDPEGETVGEDVDEGDPEGETPETEAKAEEGKTESKKENVAGFQLPETLYPISSYKAGYYWSLDRFGPNGEMHFVWTVSGKKVCAACFLFAPARRLLVCPCWSDSVVFCRATPPSASRTRSSVEFARRSRT